jgi:hypothetical protein
MRSLWIHDGGGNLIAIWDEDEVATILGRYFDQSLEDWLLKEDDA